MKPCNSLQQAIDLSDQILNAIDLQQLDDISRLDDKRRVVIDLYYENTKSIDARLTLDLKQKNDQIISLLINLQQKIRSRQIDLNRSQKVSKAYLANTTNDHR